MFDRRKALSEVFIDTQLFYRENSVLAAAVEHSKQNTRLFLETEYPELPEKRGQDAMVAVTKFTSFGAARLWKKTHPDHRVAVLNFASAVTPGGGVKHGSSAQEESLCRCSTLYPTLDQRFLWDAYYNKNRNVKNVLHTDDCIWSPEIIICKTDESIPNRMEERNWVTVDVISCAAPNLRQNPNNFFNPEGGAAVNLSDEDLYALHLQRAKHIMHIAASHRVDTLILGAFGCGAFENNPLAVAQAYRAALPEYRAYFKRIEFAVYCRKYETGNFDAFNAVLSQM